MPKQVNVAGRTVFAALAAFAVFANSQCSQAAGGGDVNALLRAGYEQICRHDYSGAIESLSTALQVNPDSVAARRYFAYALMHRGLAAQAVMQFEYVNRMEPGSARDMTLLGDAYFYTGAYERAVDQYKLALVKEPSLFDARAGLVHALVAKGDNQRAGVVCKQAVVASAGLPVSAKYEALLHEIQGDPAEKKDAPGE